MPNNKHLRNAETPPTERTHHGHYSCPRCVNPLEAANSVRTSGIERQPAPPKHEQSHASVHRISHREGIRTVGIASQTRTKHNCRRKRRRSADDVHRTTAGNVYHAQFVQKSVLAPNPASRNAVHDGVQKREQAIRFEVAPVN